MLPNWLYGKSKSKLASILGGGGGIPEDYNQVKAQVTQNAEDILLLSDALDDKAALKQISNHNILHNPWFNVNQRGVTSVNTGGAFIADRWKVASEIPGFIVTRTSDGYLDVDNSEAESSYTAIYQKRTETYINSLDGMKITASVMFSDGSIKSGTVTFDHTTNQNYYSDDEISLGYSSPTILGLNVKGGYHLTVKALKLEVGEVSTLAMDPRPEYATELAKCQRYFQNILNTDASNNRLIGIAYAVSTTSARMLVTLPDHMRTNAPSFSKSGDFVLQPIAGGTAIDVTSVSSLGLMETYINIRADVASGLTAGSAYFFQAKPNAALNFNAEL